MRMNQSEKVTIILPTLNEEDAIGTVIDELINEGYENILVVDGNSTDKTREIAKSKQIKVVKQDGKGKTDAIKKAVNYVETQFLLIMDCDYTYDPKDIEKFFKKIMTSDQVIGIRNLRNKSIPKLNQYGNSLITNGFNLATGSKLHDVCSGMYMFHTEFIKKIDFDSRGFGVELMLAAKTGEIGRVSEIPINYRERIGKEKNSMSASVPIVCKEIFKFVKIYNPSLLFALFSSSLIIPGFVLLIWMGLRWIINPEDYRPGIIQIAIILMVIGSNGVAFTLISSHLRRIERKINSILWKNGNDPSLY
jgi:dolichol-phosphate hexosyltransferase